MLSCQNDQCGFTLIETLTAIFIFSLLALSCNAILSLMQKNALEQKEHDVDVMQKQQTVSLLTSDFLQAKISKQQLMLLTPFQQQCSHKIEFYTSNFSNPENAYGNTVYKVSWIFSDKGVWRTAILPDGYETKKMLKSAMCFDFRVFERGQWVRNQTISRQPIAMAFNLSLSPYFNIERFIPFDMQPKVGGNQ